MPRTIAEIMTSDLATVESSESAAEAARLMAATDARTVLVLENGKVCGILTARDIVILVAEGKSSAVAVTDVISDRGLLAVSPDTSVDRAISLMRGNAVRRILVVQEDRTLGVVSLSDLAIARDPESALAAVPAARGNS